MDPLSLVVEQDESQLMLSQDLAAWTDWRWRVDEVSAAGVTADTVWSFRTGGQLEAPVHLRILWIVAGPLLEWDETAGAALCSIHRLPRPGVDLDPSLRVAETSSTT